jgi:hypothetical protein
MIGKARPAGQVDDPGHGGIVEGFYVACRTLLPHLSDTKQENIHRAKSEAMAYPKWGECREQGYFWATDVDGRKFRDSSREFLH